jgi:hypothetical protein
LQIPNQRNRLILPDITPVKALAIQIAGLYFIVIQDCQPADSFTNKRGRNVAHKATRTNTQNVASAVFFLVKSCNALLAVEGARNADAHRFN